ncbi:MAG: AI-2E family transporter [Xanthomonadales bacterium]|nr:AI-2E family transporter [Xanthomonadales bacterium]
MTTDSRNWLMLALLAGGGWLVYLLAPVITPFAISAVLAYLGDPLVDRLEKVSLGRWKLGRTVAVSIVFVLMLSLLTIVLLIIVPLLVEQIRTLMLLLPRWVEWFSATALPWLAGKLGVELKDFDPAHFSQVFKDYWREISTAAFKVVDYVSRGGMAVAALVTNLILIPVVTFYLLRDWDPLIRATHDLLPRNMEAEISRMLNDMDKVLGAFFRGQLMVMLALGLIYSIGLSLVGVELGVLIGMGAGLLSIVPYLGSIVGVLVAAGAAIFQFQDAFHLLMVLLVFGVGQTAEGMYLTPKLVGDQIGLHPVTVIFAVLAGGQLFGFLGILLALPVAAALNVLVRNMLQKYRQSELYKLSPDRES